MRETTSFQTEGNCKHSWHGTCIYCLPHCSILICLVLFHVTLFCNMRKNKKKAAIFWHDRFSDQGENKPINEILHYNVSLGHTLVVSQLHITLNYTKICAIHIKHNSGTIKVVGLWFWIIENQDGSAHDCMSLKSSIWDISV